MKNSVPFTGLLTAGLIAVAAQSQADGHYDYQIVDYPGAPFTSLFGVNDRGDAVGSGSDGPTSFPFVYSIKKGIFTDVPVPTEFDALGLVGNSDSGVTTGSAFDADAGIEYGVILDKKGNVTAFQHPDAFSFTQGRDVNNKGLVSGFHDTEEGFLVGFIYDPKKGTFTPTNDTPTIGTIAHGSNAQGEVVGNSLFEEDPCGSDDLFVTYAWKRGADGALTYFSVNGLPTRARGISDDGTITGFVATVEGFKGFVTELGEEACQEITLPESELLAVPGAISTIPEGITNSGTVVGVAIGADSQSGFVATPTK